MKRRDFLSGAAGAGAVAALPAGAAAQDGNTTDSDGGSTDGTTYEPPDDFIGDAGQAIGADRMIIGALKYDESDRTPDGFTEATMRVLEAFTHRTVDYYDTPTNLEDAAGNGILQIDRMDNASHHVLVNMFNEIQLAADKAWFDGMVAFLQEADDGQDKSTCVNAATGAGLESFARIQRNLLTWWKEQMNQLKAYRAYLNESFDFETHEHNLSDVLTANLWENSGAAYPTVYTGDPWYHSETSIDLVDGSTVQGVPGIAFPVSRSNSDYVGKETIYPHSTPKDPYPKGIPLISLPDGSVTNGLMGFDNNHPTSKAQLLDAVDAQNYTGPAEAFESELDSNLTRANMYNVLWDWLVQESSVIEANLNEWANNMYGSLQSGEIDIAGIVEANPTLAASEFSTEYSSTGHYSYVAASMASMGVAYDYEHEMHVELHDGTKLEGTLFVSESDFSVQVGREIDPENLTNEGHVYFAFDGSSAIRQLPSSEYQEAVDGGVATLTTTPTEGTLYRITTTHGETVEIEHSAWEPVDEQAATDPDATTNWKVDLSDQLETVITSVESIQHYYPEDTGSSLIRLTEPFVITEAYNVETGDSVDTVEGEQGTDLSETDVQFTEEDLEAFREMVEAVNQDAGPSNTDRGGISIPSLPNLENPASALVGVLVLLGGGAFAVSAWNGRDDSS